MSDSPLQQVLAVHDAYGAMLAKLLHTLVVDGKLTPTQGAETIAHGRLKLSQSGIAGEVVDDALRGFDGMAAAISPAPRSPKRPPAP